LRVEMNSNRNHRWAGGVGIAAGAALIGLAPAARADDMQISIDGTDLFPTAGNTAMATSDTGDIAIAIGNGADADATGGVGDFAYVDGANSIAEAGHNGDFDTALVSGTNSTAEAGFGVCGIECAFPVPGGIDLTPHYEFDTAAVFGNGFSADATSGSFVTDIQPAAMPAAAPAADGPGPFEDLFGTAGANAWTPAADASLLSSDPTEAANLDASVENFLADVPISTQFPDGDDPFSFITWEVDPSTFTADPTLNGGLPDNALGDAAVALDYSLFVSGLGGNDVGIADSLNFLANLPDTVAGWSLALLFFPEDLLLIPILAAA
jgi:hypothetical protein